MDKAILEGIARYIKGVKELGWQRAYEFKGCLYFHSDTLTVELEPQPEVKPNEGLVLAMQVAHRHGTDCGYQAMWNESKNPNFIQLPPCFTSAEATLVYRLMDEFREALQLILKGKE
jgi:hypothetical protein